MNNTKGINTIRNSMKLFHLGIKFSKEFFVWKLIWVLVKAARTVLVDVLLLKFVLDAITEGKTFYETIGFVLICISISFAEMYMQDKAILIITHRLSTVKHVDTIYFM